MDKESPAARDTRLLRRDLYRDAERARAEGFPQDYIDPERWGKYHGAAGRRLYASFADEELLDILRLTADELGRPPCRREVFCVYCSFICRRFGNWPSALRAAGLKAPRRTMREKRRAREAERRSAAAGQQERNTGRETT